MSIIDLPPLGLTRRQVVILFGAESLVMDAVAAGWLKPLVQRGRLTLFNRNDVLATWERIAGGELPPRRIK